MKRYLLLMTVAVLPFVFSCTRTSIDDGPVPGTKTETEVVMALRLPGNYSTNIASVEENHIRTAYILSFRADQGTTDGSEPFDYMALAHTITDAADTRYKSLGVTLQRKEYPQKFVIIANAKKTVDQLGLSEGSMTLDQVLESLEFANADIWHSEMGSSFIPLPMWGETEAVTVNSSTQKIGTVILTRMVARLDVVKDDSIDDKTFEITSLHLYNHLTNGRLCPHRAATHWHPTEWKALLPTLPSSNYDKVRGPHAVSTVDAGDGTTRVPVMYAFESEAPSDGSSANATCMVVGGRYEGAASDSYYRVDIFDKDENGNITGFKDLLRNHLYRLNIIAVKGGGFPDPDEAFESKAIDMDVVVQQWDEGSVSEAVFDKQYMLGVSQTEYSFARNACTDNLLIVTTNVPEGWDVSNDSENWLHIGSRTYNAPNGKDDLYFDLDENPGPAERTARLTISAGRMSIVVKVTQSTDDKYTLEVLDEKDMALTGILFTSYGNVLAAESRSARIRWTPTAEDCTVTYTDLVNSGLRFENQPNPFLTAVIKGGIKNYTVCPDEFTATELDSDPFMEKTASVDFSVGSGTYLITKTVSLRHIHYDLFARPADSYPLDGSEHSFTLETNASWTVTASGNTALASLAATSGSASPSGAEFYFTMSDDGSHAGSPMLLTFTYTGVDGRSATKTVTLNGEPSRGIKDVGHANSYILEPGGEGIEIPLSWANGSPYGERIAPGDKVTLKVLWLDTDRGIAANSVISGYKLIGDGASGKIEVYPGSQEGNALIAAYVGNDIKWSWHIWVTNYDFESTGFTLNNRKWMNINLGAITDTRGDVNSYGLFYQWGRKDPFAPAVSVSNFTQRPLWDESGTPVKHIFEDTSRSDNIEYAISNPVTFYVGNSGNDSDWSSSDFSNKDNYLWSEKSTGGKTHYDPCPYGWRTAYRTDGKTTNPMNQLGYGGAYQSTVGIYFSAHDCYWQCCGLISYDGVYKGAMTSSDTEGYYWAGTSGPQYGFFMQLFSYGAGVDDGKFRGYGMNVRCVEDK